MKIRVIYIVPGFAENEEDTSCIPALQELALALHNTNEVELKIIALNYPKKSEYTWHDISVVSLGRGNKKRTKLISAISGFQSQLLALVKAYKPDIIHGFWLTDAGLEAARIGKKLQIATVLTAMGQDVYPSFYISQIKRHNVSIVSISSFQKKKLEEIQLAIKATIPHGIRPFSIGLSASKEIDIVTVGSLIPVKNPDLALNCVHRLIQEGNSVTLSFIGDGSLRMDLKAKANELGIHSSVSFLGSLNRVETFRHMSKANILLHTANFEGFGMVLAEAEALGLHIVSTPVGIAPNIPKAHIFRTEDQCVAYLKQCLSSKEKPNVSFPISNTTEAYLALYVDLLKS